MKKLLVEQKRDGGATIGRQSPDVDRDSTKAHLVKPMFACTCWLEDITTAVTATTALWSKALDSWKNAFIIRLHALCMWRLLSHVQRRFVSKRTCLLCGVGENEQIRRRSVRKR